MDYPTHRSHLLLTPRENDISASQNVEGPSPQDERSATTATHEEATAWH
jgi:hypothetical protein